MRRKVQRRRRPTGAMDSGAGTSCEATGMPTAPMVASGAAGIVEPMAPNGPARLRAIVTAVPVSCAEGDRSATCGHRLWAFGTPTGSPTSPGAGHDRVGGTRGSTSTDVPLTDPQGPLSCPSKWHEVVRSGEER